MPESNTAPSPKQTPENQQEYFLIRYIRKTLFIGILTTLILWFVPIISFSTIFEYCSLGLMATCLTFGLNKQAKQDPITTSKPASANETQEPSYLLGIKHPVSLFLILGVISTLCSNAAYYVYTVGSLWAVPAAILLALAVISSYALLHLSCKYCAHILSDPDPKTDDKTISVIATCTILYEFVTFSVHLFAIYFTSLNAIHAKLASDIALYILRGIEMVCFSSRAYDNLSLRGCYSTIKQVISDIASIAPVDIISNWTKKTADEIRSKPGNNEAIKSVRKTAATASMAANLITMVPAK
jgi:hypothetical protein